MLVLSRKIDEAIVIADSITVRVLEINGDRVKLGIAAPSIITILRQELCDAVMASNLEAARAPRLDAAKLLPSLRKVLRGEEVAQFESEGAEG